MPSLEDRLAALEAAVTRLGAPQGEALVPTYITIDPTTGLVSATFTGLVVASGILLPEAVLTGHSGSSSITWQDSTGVTREWIQGFFSAGGHQLVAYSNPDVNDHATLNLKSTVGGSLGSAVAQVQTSDNAGGSTVATILDSAQRSTFLQVGGVRYSSFFSGSVSFAGGSQQSNTVTLTLPGATGSVVGVCTFDARSDGGGPVAPRLTPLGGGQVLLQCACIPPTGNPAAGVTCGYNALVWGN